MILLDTSFLFAYFCENDTNHKKALDLASQLDDCMPILPVEVFEELMTVITYKVSSEKATEIGELLLDPKGAIRILYGNEKIFKASWEQFQSLSPHKFSFIDCMLVTLAKELQCQVFTFDKKIDKLVNI